MSERTNHLDAMDDLEGATLSRRSFLVGAGAAGALTMLGLAGCAPSTSASGDAAASASADAAEPAAGGEGGGGAAGPAMGGGAADPTWRTDPGASSFDPKETRDFDVVVLGAGHAGVACAHKAAELGKKVVLVEKQAEENYQNLGNENGHINSEWQKSHGVPEVDPMTFFNNWQLNSGNRAEPDILVYCFRHFSRSGRALYLPFQIWDKGRVEGGGRRTTSWDLALDDRIAPPTRSVTWIRQDGRSGLDI